MPEWLLNKDNYSPSKERDDFINKSILSILKVLTKFRLEAQYIPDKFNVSASTKILTTVVLILLISLTRNIEFLISVGVFLLLIVSLLNAVEIRYILRVGLAACIFTFVILIPSILMGNKNNSILIVFKVLETATLVSITSCTTRWSDITSAIKMFFIPDIFIMVMDMTMKYIIIFGEFSINMLYSLRLRSIGKNNKKDTSLSGIIGTMFLKSKEMAEEMYGAMECRGFTGEYKVNKKYRLKFNDGLCIFIGVLFIFSYFYFDRL
jgi:cobalt/nickel transport system permease protein